MTMTKDAQESQCGVVVSRERIRNLFLGHRESYGPDDALALTGLGPERIRGAIGEGVIEGEVSGDGFRVAWEQLAALALDVWGIDTLDVEEALVEEAARVLPPLVRSVTLTVRVPCYQVAVLRALARQHGVPVDALVREALQSLTEECGEELEIPGLWQAIDFPLGNEREEPSAECRGS